MLRASRFWLIYAQTLPKRNFEQSVSALLLVQCSPSFDNVVALEYCSGFVAADRHCYFLLDADADQVGRS